jgi:aryl-alcohol dehydrogenase-like predicted oxidoreductase
MTGRIAGAGTRAGTNAYAQSHAAGCGAGHFSDFLNLHLKLASLGIGTFPGAATDAVDAAYEAIVARAALGGINVFDTAAHYRYGRSMRALGSGLRRAFEAGVAREQVFVVAKAGFLAFDDRPPEDLARWFDAHIAARGLGTLPDLAGHHLLTPQYIVHQLDRLRDALGLDTIDALLVDQPEVHVPVAGKERMHRRLGAAFAALEQQVKLGTIGCYGISSFHGFRVETDAAVFQSLTSLLGLAEKAAALVHGAGARHALRVVQLPFNQAMTEGFTRFSHATGQGNVASTIQAAHQLRVYVMATHSMGKGVLAREASDAVRAKLVALPNDAQRALQFNRSTPGIGTSLVGISTPAHLDDALAVARLAPIEKAAYLSLYERA